MRDPSLKIVPCPPHWRDKALALTLVELPSEQRLAIAGAADHDTAGLLVALQSDRLIGACWAQSQPGNSAVFWPPQLSEPHDVAADQLLAAATTYLDRCRFGLTQVLTTSSDAPVVSVLQRHGFFILAELAYLAWDTDQELAAGV